MTKAEWLTCSDPQEMLPQVEWASNRKLRLFACACCRRIWSDIRDEQCRAAVIGSEQYADDLISPTAFAELSVAAHEAYGAAHRSAQRSSAIIALYAAHYAAAGENEGWHVSDVLRATVEAPGATSDESSAQADLLRDIFGNTFHKVKFKKEWRTNTVLALARQMYDSRDFSAMPILADALQDAGCDNPEILDHCRGPGPHVRGCWVVDLVLDKE
jgi:hypothetical protein